MKNDIINTSLILLVLLLGLLAHFNEEPFLVTLMTRIVIFALAGVGLNLALGYGGLVSLGHAAFWGVGGYVAGILIHHAQTYLPIYEGYFTLAGTENMLLIWLIALIVSGFLALLIGLLSLRTSGVYFIMVTLAFAQMIYYFAISWSAYGGEDGLSLYSRSQFPGLDSLQPLHFFLICYGVLFIVLHLNYRFNHSHFGLALNAVRQSPERVETVGVSPFKLRLTAFVISGMLTGLAGALFADLNRFVSPEMLSWQVSGEIMIFVILGGVGRLMGPCVGAAVFVFLEHVLGGISDYWHFYLGVLLLLIVLFAKGGIMGIILGKKVQHE